MPRNIFCIKFFGFYFNKESHKEIVRDFFFQYDCICAKITQVKILFASSDCHDSRAQYWWYLDGSRCNEA